MTITALHIGVVGQQEFAKLAVMGSDGRLEVMLPMSDVSSETPKSIGVIALGARSPSRLK